MGLGIKYIKYYGLFGSYVLTESTLLLEYSQYG